ncbi:hypothetical protein [Spirosoma fluviale]|uniref:Uncharacterized protein n=1 Tax=Spirosoma fluviale TaxID=1597977 RepID=A0A286F5I5_9BACT|nr:hypothetical protein [Spirosoma fluviale]SOD78468.1 hypothetical protein SAMN06269250_0477 [Spirosoma fluviale]
MTTFEQVLRKAQTLQEALEKVQSNHFYWQKKTRPLLEATLKQVQTGADINWLFHEVNAESVQLRINDDQEQELAALTFRLAYNSLVSIHVTYYTTLHNPEARALTYADLHTVEPGQVDESLIHNSVTRFIDLLLKEYFTQPAHDENLRAKRYIRTSVPPQR